jgi:hypothetical protein
MMPKISKESAQAAKDKARAMKQQVMRDAGKRLTMAERARISDLNKVIDAANEIINEE